MSTLIPCIMMSTRFAIVFSTIWMWTWNNLETQEPRCAKVRQQRESPVGEFTKFVADPVVQ